LQLHWFDFLSKGFGASLLADFLCRSSKTKGINIVISNEFLEWQGLGSLRQVWINIQYFIKEDEPPSAEPHAGCGG